MRNLEISGEDEVHVTCDHPVRALKYSKFQISKHQTDVLTVGFYWSYSLLLPGCTGDKFGIHPLCFLEPVIFLSEHSDFGRVFFLQSCRTLLEGEIHVLEGDDFVSKLVYFFAISLG